MNAGTTTKIKASSKDESSGSSNVPSGFILKLYQMVNGAPNEVISVSPCSSKEQNESFFARIPCFDHGRHC